MSRRMILPHLLLSVEILAIAVLAAWLATWPVHSMAVSLSTGVTAGWMAGLFLPTPRRRGGR